MALFKKLFSLTIAALISLSFCGCKNQTQERLSVASVFSCDFSSTYNGMNISGKLDLADDGATIVINKPSTLSGLKITMPQGENTTRGGMTVSMYGTEFDFDSEKYPQTAFAGVLVNTLKNSALEECDYDSDTKTLSGNYNGTNYTITLDEQNRPIIIEIPEYSFKTTLSNFK